MSQTDPRTSLAAGLAVGLASAAVLGVGVIMLYLLFRKDQRQPLGLAPPQPLSLTLGYPQVPDQAALWSSPTQQPIAVTKVSPKIFGSGPTLSTSSVPTVSPVWVASAGSVPNRVTVRPLSPPGGFLALAYNAGTLTGTDFDMGNTFTIPVGSEQEIRLLPKQSLFARGVAPAGAGTTVTTSVLRADAPGDV